MDYDREALERELAAYEAQGKTARAAQVRALLGIESAAAEAPENAAAPRPTRKIKG